MQKLKEKIQQQAKEYATSEAKRYCIKHPFPEGFPEAKKESLMDIFTSQCSGNYTAGAEAMMPYIEKFAEWTQDNRWKRLPQKDNWYKHFYEQPTKYATTAQLLEQFEKEIE